MADIFHPLTGLLAWVPDSAVPTHRRGGWVLLTEWWEMQAAQQQLAESPAEEETPSTNGNGAAKGTGAEPGTVAKVEEKI